MKKLSGSTLFSRLKKEQEKCVKEICKIQKRTWLTRPEIEQMKLAFSMGVGAANKIFKEDSK